MTLSMKEDINKNSVWVELSLLTICSRTCSLVFQYKQSKYKCPPCAHKPLLCSSGFDLHREKKKTRLVSLTVVLMPEFITLV